MRKEHRATLRPGLNAGAFLSPPPSPSPSTIPPSTPPPPQGTTLHCTPLSRLSRRERDNVSTASIQCATPHHHRQCARLPLCERAQRTPVTQWTPLATGTPSAGDAITICTRHPRSTPWGVCRYAAFTPQTPRRRGSPPLVAPIRSHAPRIAAPPSQCERHPQPQAHPNPVMRTPPCENGCGARHTGNLHAQAARLQTPKPRRPSISPTAAPTTPAPENKTPAQPKRRGGRRCRRVRVSSNRNRIRSATAVREIRGAHLA